MTILEIHLPVVIKPVNAVAVPPMTTSDGGMKGNTGSKLKTANEQLL